MKSTRPLIAVLVVAALAAACGSDTDAPAANPSDPPPPATAPATEPTMAPTDPAPPAGDVAVWRVADGEEIDATSTSFTALVSRLDCANGITGEVLAPTIELGDENIVVTFTVEPNDPEGEYTCPSNDEVPYAVDLGEPIGSRPIIDGACLEDGRAATTSFCTPSAERWTP